MGMTTPAAAPSTTRVIAYAVLWQIAWFAAVMPAGKGLPWVGVLAAIPVLVLGAWGRWQSALALCAVALPIGIVVDAALGLSGVARFPGGLLDGRLSTPWMWLLWLQLALALDLCLSWLRKAWWLPLVFGAVGGALAYRAGVAFGAMEAPAGIPALLLCTALAYLIAMPLLLRLSPCSVPSSSPA